VNTLKSAAVMLALAGVLYGVYTALNKPAVPPPADVAAKHNDLEPPQVEMAGGPTSLASGFPAPPTTLPAAEELSPADAGTIKEPSGSSGSVYSQNGLTGANRQSSYESPVNDAAHAGESSSAPPLEAPPATSPPPLTPSPKVAEVALRYALQEAEQQVHEGKFKAALANLTSYYSNSELTSDERAQLTAWLDALAAKVIYSREHLLASPYEVRRNESLFDIAQKLQVPWHLLQSVNREVVNDPRVMVPGTQLKVVPGPFRADVSLATSELTLFLGEMYAGRFPFSLGNEPPQPGSYKVLDKLTNRTYYAADGRTIPANDPANPYGETWIDLGHEASIHGSPLASAAPVATLGCISLSPQDARDVFGILSVGSDVTIRR
jgi:lipoprotein-anchoring transpeptidase ErfK/SrfK